LLAAGVHAFTTEDAAVVAGVKPDSARPALARLVKNKLAFSPARGLYIPIPPEYRSWGAVPALWFVDALMAHLDRVYYVGYLSAAEVHGAAHQRPQVFQVVVDRDLRARSFGRVRLRFITNRDAHVKLDGCATSSTDRSPSTDSPPAPVRVRGRRGRLVTTQPTGVETCDGGPGPGGSFASVRWALRAHTTHAGRLARTDQRGEPAGSG
jgi:hypothetical protein